MRHDWVGPPGEEQGVANIKRYIRIVPAHNCPGQCVVLGSVSRWGGLDSGFEYHPQPAVVADGARKCERACRIGHPGSIVSSNGDWHNHSVASPRKRETLYVDRPDIGQV